MVKKQVSVRTFIITIAAVMIAAGLVIVIINRKSKEPDSVNAETVSFRYGDSLSGFPVVNSEGTELPELPGFEKTAFVLYLSDTCKGCMDVLTNIGRIKSILGKEDLQYVFLWKNRIPHKILQKYEIAEEECYALENKTNFATTTPAFYLTDSSGTVTFSSTEPELFIEKIMDLKLVPQSTLAKNADAYIKEHYLREETGKKQMVYFAMEGCKDCLAADPVIEGKEIQDAYDVTKLYRYDDTEETHEKDVYQLLRFSYGIDWYPSFLIFEDGSTKVIGETPVEKLQSVLLDQ